MVNFTYNNAKQQLGLGTIDFATDDFRTLFVMTSTTADADVDALTIGDFTTLGEFDGAGYVAGGVALAAETWLADAPNNRSEFDADDANFGNLSAGSLSIQAQILYQFITSVSLSVPIAYWDTVSGGTTFPFAPTGTNVTTQWDVEGILHQL